MKSSFWVVALVILCVTAGNAYAAVCPMEARDCPHDHSDCCITMTTGVDVIEHAVPSGPHDAFASHPLLSPALAHWGPGIPAHDHDADFDSACYSAGKIFLVLHTFLC